MFFVFYFLYRLQMLLGSDCLVSKWKMFMICSICLSVICSDPGIPQVIRPPPPDLVQQHSPLPTPALGNSPVHRPSPSPSPPYLKGPQSGPGRPAVGISTLRERRNSTSSVTISTNKTITSITSTERGIWKRQKKKKQRERKTKEVNMCYVHTLLYFLFNFLPRMTCCGFTESYNANLHTPPPTLSAMTSPRPDVTHLSGGPPVLPPSGPNTSRGRNPLRRDLVHRKDSIKEVLQPSLSDPENPPKFVVVFSFFRFYFFLAF